jgi:ketosteroid isomerase-like protein
MLEEEFTVSDTLQLIQEAYEGFKVGDLAPMYNMLAFDVEWQSVGPSIIPIFGHWRGPAGVREYYALLRENIEYDQFEPQEYLESGDTIVIPLYVRGRVKSTGRPYSHYGVHLLRLREGLIIHRRAHCDTAGVYAAFRPAEPCPICEAPPED